MANPAAWSIGQRAALACILEVTARKPGNVHPWAARPEACYLDFVLSAHALANPLDRVAELGLGRTVLECIRATRQVTNTNTNLGIVLLFCPMALAAMRSNNRPLADSLKEVLQQTTVEDTRHVFEAIRLAEPGGLGRVSEEDVHNPPTRPLRDVMAIAGEWDNVAWQYACDYEDVIWLRDVLVEELQREQRTWEQAIIRAFLQALSRWRDTLIQRKFGTAAAESVSRKASDVIRHGWPDTARGIEVFCLFDKWLRRQDPPLNPGTTADLVAAALFWLLIEDPDRIVQKFRQPLTVSG